MHHKKSVIASAVALMISSSAIYAQDVQVKQLDVPTGSASAVLSQAPGPNSNATAVQNLAAKESAPVDEESKFGSWSVSGMLRQEAAVKTTADQNMMNRGGNPMNGVNYVSTGLAGPINLTRPGSMSNNASMNLLSTQGVLNLDGKFNENWSAHFKARYYTDELSVNGGGPSMQQTYGSGNNGGSLGIAKNNNLLDLPIAYLDYSNGPLWLRMGNQQIAWGEAVFFRVSDLANGLDLREQSVFGVAAEEFSNMRVSSPAIRANYQFDGGKNLDTFVSMFAPTILPNQGTAYNPIASQFIVDQSGYNQVKNSLNVGGRFQGKIDALDTGFQLFAVNRNNPDGVYKWTGAQGGTAIPGAAFSGASNNGNNGVYNAKEWFTYASASNLDGLGALSSALNQFSIGNSASSAGYNIAKGCGAGGGVGSLNFNQTSAACTLDTFFSGGNLNGWLAREYKRESVFGGGVNKVFNGEPDSIMDQLIGRFEFNFTPQKTFTNPTLSNQYLVQNDINTALVLEKYQKFSSSLPATYMVAQWMHRTASNIFGQSLAGMNNVPGQAPTGVSGGANYAALVFQQPTPSLEYRFDLTLLNDLRGGTLIQPGIKWKVNKQLQADLYGNIITSNGGNQTNFTQNLKYANQVLMRLSAYF